MNDNKSHIEEFLKEYVGNKENNSQQVQAYIGASWISLHAGQDCKNLFIGIEPCRQIKGTEITKTRSKQGRSLYHVSHIKQESCQNTNMLLHTFELRFVLGA